MGFNLKDYDPEIVIGNILLDHGINRSGPDQLVQLHARNLCREYIDYNNISASSRTDFNESLHLYHKLVDGRSSPPGQGDKIISDLEDFSEKNRIFLKTYFSRSSSKDVLFDPLPKQPSYSGDIRALINGITTKPASDKTVNLACLLTYRLAAKAVAAHKRTEGFKGTHRKSTASRKNFSDIIGKKAVSTLSGLERSLSHDIGATNSHMIPDVISGLRKFAKDRCYNIVSEPFDHNSVNETTQRIK